MILVAEPGDVRLCDAVDRELGPILRRGLDPLWPDWLEWERHRMARACAQIQGRSTDTEQHANYLAYLAMLESHVIPTTATATTLFSSTRPG